MGNSTRNNDLKKNWALASEIWLMPALLWFLHIKNPNCTYITVGKNIIDYIETAIFVNVKNYETELLSHAMKNSWLPNSRVSINILHLTDAQIGKYQSTLSQHDFKKFLSQDNDTEWILIHEVSEYKKWHRKASL